MRSMGLSSAFCLLALLAAQDGQAQVAAPILKAGPPEFVEFVAGSATCDADLRTARIPLQGSIRLSGLAREQVKASVAFNVNGAEVGTQTFRIERLPKDQGLVRFKRMVLVPGERPTGVAVLTVNGTRLPLQQFSYSCLRAAPPGARVPTGLRLPDLAVKSLVIVKAAPLVFAEGCQRDDVSDWYRFWNCGPFNVPYLRVGSRGGGIVPPALILDPEGKVLPIHETTPYGKAPACPIESDAKMTVRFAVAFLSTGIEDVGPYVGEGFWRPRPRSASVVDYEPGGFVSDTRLTQRFGEPGDYMMPMGYQWVHFDRLLPCTRDGTFEYTIDAKNELPESDETNNTIRFRFATVPPDRPAGG